MFNEKLVMACLELFDLMDLKDLVWVNDADLDTFGIVTGKQIGRAHV